MTFTDKAPARIEHLLPDEAERVDRAARAILSHLMGFGYRLVVPSLIEDINTLLDGDSEDTLGKRTLRLTDPLGGEPIGIRADMTPQVSRIDQRHFSDGTSRLCYCGSTLYSRPARPWMGRELTQVGAELYGGDMPAAAIEIVMLAVDSLKKAGVNDIGVALGHAGIVNACLDGLDEDAASKAKRLLESKDRVSLAELGLDTDRHEMLVGLMAMLGERADLEKWRGDLPGNALIEKALAETDVVATELEGASVSCTVDIAGLTGYQYHNGVAFAIMGGETELGRGGGYGLAARPACGFSVDVRGFADAPTVKRNEPECFASVPRFDDRTWRDAVSNLVARGMRCVPVDSLDDIPGDCRKKLERDNDKWVLTNC